MGIVARAEGSGKRKVKSSEARGKRSRSPSLRRRAWRWAGGTLLDNLFFLSSI